jgi:hypothetical protein
VMWCFVPKHSSQEKIQTRARAASCYGDGLDNGTLGRQGLYRGAVNIGGFFLGEFQL